MKVAVVGGGVAGLSCARALAARGAGVVVFDKGRAPGGRLATRRTEHDAFDLGAQYVTARSAAFEAWLAEARVDGDAGPWAGRVVAIDPSTRAVRATTPAARTVGVPSMSRLGRRLALGLDVRAGHLVDRLARTRDGYRLEGAVAAGGETLPPATAAARGAADFGAFDAVVVTAPAPQAAALLEACATDLARAAAGATLVPCVALGLAFDDVPPSLAALDFDAAFADDGSPLAWIARESSKPGRAAGERWVLHGTPAFSSAATLPPGDTSAEHAVRDELLASFAALLGAPALAASRHVLRRWAYAKAPSPAGVGHLVDPSGTLGVAGDWLADGRVEGAFLAGRALAEQLLAPAPRRTS